MSASLFLQSYCRTMALHTDAPEIYHYAAAFSIVSALSTRYKYRIRLASGEPSKWMNSWTILVGDSGIARKSTAISMATQILKLLDADMIAPSDMSPEGFLNQLGARNRAEKNNACTLLVASELSLVLAQFGRSYSGTLKPMLMELYDTEKDFKRALARSTLEIPTPRVSLLGGIATELLPRYTTSEDWHGGFFSRSLVVVGTKNKELDRGKSVEEKVYAKFAANLKDAFTRCRSYHRAKGRPRIDYDKKAGKLATDFANKQLTHQDPDVRIVMSRAPIHLMRTAWVEQFDEDPESLEIKGPAVERAMKNLLLPWSLHLPDVVMECCARDRTEFEGDRLAKRVFRFLQRHGGEATFTATMRGCALNSRAFNEAVNSLVEAAMVERTEDGNVNYLKLIARGADGNFA